MKLRTMQIKDVEAVTNILMNLNVTKYLSTHFRDREKCQAYVQFYLMRGPRRGAPLPVVIEHEGYVIGYFACYDYEEERVRVTYVLDEKCWGQGIVARLLPYYLKNLFESLNVYRIEALYVAENIASERVLEKVGFQVEGIMRNYTRDDTTRELINVGLASYIREDE